MEKIFFLKNVLNEHVNGYEIDLNKILTNVCVVSTCVWTYVF
jgi:hypothetical protein